MGAKHTLGYEMGEERKRNTVYGKKRFRKKVKKT